MTFDGHQKNSDDDPGPGRNSGGDGVALFLLVLVAVLFGGTLWMTRGVWLPQETHTAEQNDEQSGEDGELVKKVSDSDAMPKETTVAETAADRCRAHGFAYTWINSKPTKSDQ